MTVHGVRRPRRLALVLLSGVLVAACSNGPSEEAEPSLTRQIEAALDAARIDGFRAVVVVQDGRTVADYRTGERDEHLDTESVTKSVLSILIGRAIDDGLLALDDTLPALLPDHVGAMAPWQRRLTLRDVLTHTAGFAGTEQDTLSLMAEPDVVAVILGRDRAVSVGSFSYSSEGSHLLAHVLRQAVGVPLIDYARRVLFDPLDIATRPATVVRASAEPDQAAVDAYLEADFTWPVDRAGVEFGWGLLKLTTADLAKIGRLMLDGGVYAGRRVVSAAWVEASTRSQVKTSPPSGADYGYHWWADTAGDEPAFAALGFGGQLVEVVPGRRLVVVMQRELDIADVDASALSSTFAFDLVEDTILPALPPAE